ncbi:hypothetical protein SAMN04488114_1092 [Carnobacterium iners]|nr:hypothetical protein SAMN04488114_1092 [Carnobacterium iners]
MLLQILFGVFAFLLFSLPFFLISGNAIVFIPITNVERKKFTHNFFLVLVYFLLF